MNTEKKPVVIIASKFNDLVVLALLQAAEEALSEAGYTSHVIRVPGAFEIPLALQQALQTQQYAGGVILGAVIRGETDHYDVVVKAAAQGVQQVMLSQNMPVGFGLVTCDTLEQALQRCGGKMGNQGAMAAQAFIDMNKTVY